MRIAVARGWKDEKMTTPMVLVLVLVLLLLLLPLLLMSMMPMMMMMIVGTIRTGQVPRGRSSRGARGTTDSRMRSSREIGRPKGQHSR